MHCSSQEKPWAKGKSSSLTREHRSPNLLPHKGPRNHLIKVFLNAQHYSMVPSPLPYLSRWKILHSHRECTGTCGIHSLPQDLESLLPSQGCTGDKLHCPLRCNGDTQGQITLPQHDRTTCHVSHCKNSADAWVLPWELRFLLFD